MKYQLLDSGFEQKLEQFGPGKAIDASFTRDPARIGGAEEIGSLQTGVLSMKALNFKLEPTDFGHLGMFPEHAELWRWLRPLQGASVCHVDASKTAVAWARQNCALNQLEQAPIRWIERMRGGMLSKLTSSQNPKIKMLLQLREKRKRDECISFSH
ncbi:hypothetical protein ACTFIV_006923 [Dictyostelium citrinum]